MDSKRLINGFAGFILGALIGAALIILPINLLYYIGFLSEIGLLIPLAGVLIGIWASFKVLKKYGAKELDLKRVIFLVLEIAVLFILMLIPVVIWEL